MPIKRMPINMETILSLINQYITYAPLIIFVALCISGFGLPISEDALVITGGILSYKHPQMLPYFYIAIFLGAFIGDNICYWFSRSIGANFVEKKISPQKLEKVSQHFKAHANLMIFFGRFIPFGMRMLVIIYAGISRFDYRKFVPINALSVLCTTGISFSLAYTFGDSIIIFLDRTKYILLGLLAAYLFFLILKKWMR